MKTDPFDETLRKKIESIEPIFHEDDWQRFTAFVGTQPIPFWKSFWGKASMYAVGTTAFTGLLIYNINQHYDQKALLQKVQTLTQQIDNLQRQQPPSQPRQAPAPDTVYVTRYLPTPVADDSDASQEPTRNNAQAETETTQLATENTPQKPTRNNTQDEDKPTQLAADNTLPKPLTSPQPEPRTALGKTSEATNADYKFANGTATNQRHGQPSAGAYHKSTKQRTSKNRQTTNGGFDEPVGGNELVNNQLAALPPVVGSLQIEPLAIIGLDSSNRMKVAEPKIFVQTTYYEAPKTPKLPFVWPKFTVRAGIGAGLSAGYVVPNFTAELFVGKRISVSSGLRISYFSTEKYFTDEQFFKRRQEDFRKMHAPKAPPTQEILNISERVHLVQIPVRLNYYQPLRSGFWLVGAVGTNLDIYGSKRVKFDLRANRSEFEQVVNIDKFPIVPLNNITFSIGLEKRFGRVVIQASPYWILQTQRLPYKMKSNNFGSDFKLLYQF